MDYNKFAGLRPFSSLGTREKIALQLRDELMGCVALEPASFLHSGYLYFSFTTTT